MPGSSPPTAGPSSDNRELPVVFCISLAVIGWQLALMRCLLIARYHHFSFLIISCALLGFGMGGALLALTREWCTEHRDLLIRWGTLGFAASLPLCFRVGELMPIDVFFPPAGYAGVLAWWAVFWLNHCIPFIIAGFLLGLFLMTGGTRVHLIYAVNLAGSAAGSLGGIALLSVLPANGLVIPLSFVVVLSAAFLLEEGFRTYGDASSGRQIGPSEKVSATPDAPSPCPLLRGEGERKADARAFSLCLAPETLPDKGVVPSWPEKADSTQDLQKGAFKASDFGRRRLFRLCLELMGFALIAAQVTGPERVFPLRIDQYKTLAFVENLVAQGGAQRTASVSGVRGRVELSTGPHFHSLLSFSSTETPPPMDVLLRDGFQVASLPVVSDVNGAQFLEGTLSSLPYKLIQPDSVLILGGSGALHIWAARLSSARSIVLVEPDRNVVNLLSSHRSRILDDPRIRVEVCEPRAFLDVATTPFDIIHLAEMEGFTAGSSGIGGLREDYLATVEGLSRCFELLTARGMACVTRGIQDPPRDNIKIAAMWIEAMERLGVTDPGDRLLMARDELSMATLVARSPIGAPTVETVSRVCRQFSWDQEWWPGISAEKTNRIHRLPGPEGTGISWFHYAVQKLLSPGREELYRNWVTYVRPATDDRPFFRDFFRWSSLERLRAALGPVWPTRSEMGFLLLVAAALWSTAMALLLLPAPIILLRRSPEAPSRSLIFFALVYFCGLGAGFMFLEMSFIQLFSRSLGDPVLAAALVIGSLLVFAGLGSLFQPLIVGPRTGRLPLVALAITVLVLVDAVAFPWLFSVAAGSSEWARAVIGVLMTAPLGFVMGMPFPWGLAEVQKGAPALVPLAWAINGFASVVSTSGAVIVAMTFGFTALSVMAASTYAVIGVLAMAMVKATGSKTGG